MMNVSIATQRLNNSAFASLDKMLLIPIVCLLMIGLVMVTSASIEIIGSRPLYFFFKHSIFVSMGLGILLVAAHIPLQYWKDYSTGLLFIAFFVLILVLLPGIGKEVNGSTRWIGVGSLFNIQASELAKLFIIIYLAAYLERHQEEVRSCWSGFLRPLLVLFFMIILLLLEPDFGAMVVLMCAALGMIFLAGAKLFQFMVLIVGCMVAMVAVVVAQPYRIQRLIAYLDPWAEENVFNSGYQLTQALIAFGRGEWFGVGLGHSIQKLHYLPEAHTDFVFSIIAEELGLMGALLIISLYLLFILKALLLARKLEEKKFFFPAYLVYGLSLLFTIQVLINIGVNIGLLPTKGLTLPLLSSGGSSLLITCLLVAIIWRADIELKQTKKSTVRKKRSKS